MMKVQNWRGGSWFPEVSSKGDEKDGGTQFLNKIFFWETLQVFVVVVLVVEPFFSNGKYLKKSKSNQTIIISQIGAQ